MGETKALMDLWPALYAAFDQNADGKVTFGEMHNAWGEYGGWLFCKMLKAKKGGDAVTPKEWKAQLTAVVAEKTPDKKLIEYLLKFIDLYQFYRCKNCKAIHAKKLGLAVLEAKAYKSPVKCPHCKRKNAGLSWLGESYKNRTASTKQARDRAIKRITDASQYAGPYYFVPPVGPRQQLNGYNWRKGDIGR